MSPHAIAYVFGAVVLVVVGQTTLKVGMGLVGPIGRERMRHPLQLTREVASVAQVWVGLSLYVASSILWLLALATAPLFVAYPLLGLSYVFIAGAAVVALGEWLTPLQWFGIILIVCGVMAVALGG